MFSGAFFDKVKTILLFKKLIGSVIETVERR
jgi:hypothetical protein